MSNSHLPSAFRVLSMSKLAPWIQLVLWVSVTGFLAYGFEWRSPKTAIDELRAADTVLEEQIGAAELRDKEHTRLLEAITIGECIDRDERELQLMGLGPDCERLLSDTR